MSHHAPATGFHGPRCWILSALAGTLVGFLISLVLAAPDPHHPDAGHAPAETRTRVFEKLPDGSIYERLGPSAAVALPPGTKVAHDLPAPRPPASDGLPASAEHRAAAESGEGHHAPAPDLTPLLIIPFALMLLSIALMPFISERTWAVHYPDFAFFLGSLMLAYYLAALGAYGREQMLHVALEYYAFIALIGGLFVASGGILVDVRGRPSPGLNTAILALGAVLANIVGTTGASVLLIRPFMRLNAGRLRPIHIILFIFIVSNCGGCLTPIGDPPLYLGFLRGVDFFWTLLHLWPMWLVCVGALLGIFFLIDSRIGPARPAGPAGELLLDATPASRLPAPGPAARTSIRIRGGAAMLALALIVGGVFIDPLLGPVLGLEGIPVGPTFQIAVAAAAFFVAPRDIHDANAFSFHPVKEVGFLFVGIFLTMAPALAYLQAHGSDLGLRTPTHYYFATGSLSAFLDNAPTYLNFLQASFGMLHLPLDAEGIERFTQATYLITSPDGPPASLHGGTLLAAISLAAVFFGAMTYIGNGPNFMVKAIAESSGLKMPGFFAYLLTALVLLLPVLVLVWAVFLA